MAKKTHSPGAKEVRLAGGEFGGRRLKGGPGIRPAPARVRAALFSILGPRIEGMRVLDLFAGTGAVALEALGRGAASAVLVDVSHSSLAALRANIKTLGLEDRAEAIGGDALSLLNVGRFAGGAFHFVFIG
ncbi:MAG: RsmD family RNA methyltransferase, partial [Candidatus Sumerlaeota bacterium]|nr:RsmD family RNA methyltransferase [Candidatus Sumerlaeota bacterium]